MSDLSLRLENVRRAIAATPWAILPEKLDAIVEVVAHHAAGQTYSDEEIAARVGAAPRRAAPAGPVAGGVAVLPIMGTIAKRIGGMERASGGASTEDIAAQFRAAVRNPEVGAIVLDVDSPGGSTAGVPELAAEIRAARGTKPIIAVANSLMASAAYWIASAADEVVASPSSMLGSIGVFSVHTDATALHEKMGVKRTIIRAGRYKAEGSPFEPLSDDARAAMQAQVDELYDAFVADVAAQRGTSPAAVRGGYGEGRVLSARQSVAAGLADRVATLDEVVAELTRRPAVASVARAAAPPSTPMAVEATSASHAPSLPSHTAPQGQENTVSDEHTAPPSGAASATPHITVGVTRDSQAPRADYLALAAAYGQSVSTVQRWQAAGLSEAQVRADIMDRERTHAAPIGASAPTDIDLSAKEQKQYSIGRAVLALASNDWRAAGLEREVSDTLAKRLNRAAAGFYVPTNAPLFNAATMTSTTSTKGAELVYSEYQGFVDLLRPRSVLAGLGARMESGLQGTYSFVRQTAGSSVEWVGENPGSDPTESDLTFEIVEANPKTAAGVLKYTRQQLAQSVEQFDALVRGDLVTVHAKEMDKVGIKAGSGNTPNGILGYTGTTLVAMGTNGGVVDYGDLIDLKSKIDVNNAQDLGTRAFLSTVELGALWEQTPRMSNTAGLPIMENGKIAGYRAEVSNHVPSNLTKGTASGTCHAIIHGVFSEVLFLEWGALDITVDAITLAKRGVIQVISHHMMNVEIKHPKAFAVIKDATLA